MLAHVAVFLLAAFALAQGADAHAQQRASDHGGVGFSGHWAYRWTTMYEDGSRLVGGGLGIVVHDRSRVELVGFGTAEPSRYSTLEFRLAYGGMQVEHEILRRGRWALGAAATLAFGAFSVDETRFDTDERTGVWLAEPELFVGLHVGEHLRLTAGGSYRWVRGVEGDIPNRSDGDASGPTLTLRLALR